MAHGNGEMTGSRFREIAGYGAVVVVDFTQRARGFQPFARGLEDAQQFAMQGLVAGDDIRPWSKMLFAAVGIGDEAAGLAHQIDPAATSQGDRLRSQ